MECEAKVRCSQMQKYLESFHLGGGMKCLNQPAPFTLFHKVIREIQCDLLREKSLLLLTYSFVCLYILSFAFTFFFDDYGISCLVSLQGTKCFAVRELINPKSTKMTVSDSLNKSTSP